MGDWTDTEARMLAKTVPHCKSIEKMDLKSNEICADGVGAICEAATQTAVQVISFTKNPLSDSGAKAISRAIPRMQGLRTLWLNECGIGNAGIEAIMSQVQCSLTLENLYLFDNEVTDEGMEAVVAALPGCTRLVAFGVGGNRISEGMIRRLQRAWAVGRPSEATIYVR